MSQIKKPASPFKNRNFIIVLIILVMLFVMFIRESLFLQRLCLSRLQ